GAGLRGEWARPARARRMPRCRTCILSPSPREPPPAPTVGARASPPLVEDRPDAALFPGSLPGFVSVLSTAAWAVGHPPMIRDPHPRHLKPPAGLPDRTGLRPGALSQLRLDNRSDAVYG